VLTKLLLYKQRTVGAVCQADVERPAVVVMQQKRRTERRRRREVKARERLVAGRIVTQAELMS